MQICFLLALVFTSSANTFLIAGLGPMVSAFLARIVLKTKIPAYTYAALILAWGGVLWMGTNGGGLQGTSLSNRELFGIFLVCVSTFCSGANFVVVQGWGGGKNLLPAAAVGSLGAGLVGLIASGAACDSLQDFGLLFVMGFVLTGVPCILIIFAGRYLLAPESALIGRVETVLGPIWPWIFVGEVPTNASLVGGAMILTALFANEGANIYREYHKPS